MFYKIYTTTGASAGTYYLNANNVGGLYYTLGGALPVSGTVAPTVDSGTSSSNDQEGLFSVLSGHAASGGSAVYPANWQGGELVAA